MRNLLHRVAHRLPHVRVEIIAVVFLFWTFQFFLWMVMMVVVQLDPKPFTRSLLYTIQISHWALVEAAGTAALSSWALLQSQHNAREIAAVQAARKSADGQAGTG